MGCTGSHCIGEQTKIENEVNKKNLGKTSQKSNEKEKESLIRCTYEVKNNNEINIINFTDEVISKIKIWNINNNKKEKLINKKVFNNFGLNVIYFIFWLFINKKNRIYFT